LGAIFFVTISLWLSEPLHGLAAWLVALGAVTALVGFRVLHWRDLVKLDWATLLLVAGGIGMGALLDRSGIVHEWAATLPLGQMSPLARTFGICLLSAVLASLMSNTGTAALLIPLAASIDASPSTAILVAVAASLGMPFVISTPPNAMAVAGGLKSSELLWPGLILMLVGCSVIALTGPLVLRAVGVP
jgi:sodium-dependent dicarboxylate transporter 2/3/5